MGNEEMKYKIKKRFTIIVLISILYNSMEIQDENRVLRRQTTWYAINIKSRREQKKAFRSPIFNGTIN